MRLLQRPVRKGQIESERVPRPVGLGFNSALTGTPGANRPYAGNV
jgi:hypothetical protein